MFVPVRCTPKHASSQASLPASRGTLSAILGVVLGIDFTDMSQRKHVDPAAARARAHVAHRRACARSADPSEAIDDWIYSDTFVQ
jgi:hypothetical protein